jgi:hypothetical protein
MRDHESEDVLREIEERLEHSRKIIAEIYNFLAQRDQLLLARLCARSRRMRTPTCLISCTSQDRKPAH